MLSRARSSDEDEPESDTRPIKRTKTEQPPSPVPELSSGSNGDPVVEASLASMLDLSDTQAESLPSAFELIAAKLIHNSRLRLSSENGKVETYQILEAEVYLKDTVKHSDPFTHGEEEQKVSGKWYFHRAPRRSAAPSTNPSGYRGGTRKGLDLTFGGPAIIPKGPSTTNVRGGILLRSFQRQSDKKVISGPSLLVDEILSASGATSLKDLVQVKWGNDSNAFTATGTRPTMLSVVPFVSPAGSKLPTLHTSPRIGLDLSNVSDSKARISFVDRPYRYFIRPDLLTSKGRVQTFAGVYITTKATGVSKFVLAATVARVTGMSEAAVKKYTDFYQAGRKVKLTSFVGSNGKGASSSPERFLAMLGALEKSRE